MDVHCEISDLRISFSARDPVVKDVNLVLPRGKTTSLVGESGSGKSLTALAILQLLPLGARVSAQSKIILNNQDNLLRKSCAAMRKIRGRSIAMIFQDAMAAFNPVLTIGEQLVEVLLQNSIKISKSAAREQVLAALNEVRIPAVKLCAQSYPHQCSGGMLQRAMIAMALLGQPEILIADEPTTSLDVTLQADLLALLQEIIQKRGMTLLFISHDLAVVKQVTDYVALMQKGRLVEYQNAEEFFGHSQTEYGQKLLRAACLQRKKRPAMEQQRVTCLQVRELRHHFKSKQPFWKQKQTVKAVDGIDLQLFRGEICALVGESGSGKTTLAHCILGLHKPNFGKIEVEKSLDKGHRGGVQTVFQNPYASMNPRMTVANILREALDTLPEKLSRQVCLQRIDVLLRQVRLDVGYKDRYPHALSGGERQRVCIARALATEPAILICDEPTSALDVSIQAEILDLLQEIQREKNISILLITHDFAVVNAVADRVIVMFQGKIVEQGEVEQIMNHPRHPYARRLLAARPQFAT
jgi:peptide/nickel transport system ATP-binding protein